MNPSDQPYHADPCRHSGHGKSDQGFHGHEFGGLTRIPAAVQAAERLAGVGGTILGVVLNRVTARSGGYYYYYYYHTDGLDGERKGLARWFQRKKTSKRSNV